MVWFRSAAAIPSPYYTDVLQLQIKSPRREPFPKHQEPLFQPLATNCFRPARTGWLGFFLAFHRAGSNEHKYVRSSAQLGWGWIRANTTLKQMPKAGDEEVRGNLQISSHMCRCPKHCSSSLGLAPFPPSPGFAKHLEIPQGQKGK